MKKRTATINKSVFRKRSNFARITPIALAVISAFALAGCSQEKKEDLTIYSSPESCAIMNPGMEKDCQEAYEKAMAEAVSSAPKYDSAATCEAEFGIEGCQKVEPDAGTGQNYQQSGGSMWMPLLAGYMFGRMMSGGMAHKPLYAPQNGTAKGKYYDSSGKSFGNATPGRRVSVDKSDLRPGRQTTQTLRRGGFGQVVANQQAMQASSKSKSGASSRSSGQRSRSFGG